MSHALRHFRRIAVRSVIAVTAVALFAATTSQYLLPTTQNGHAPTVRQARTTSSIRRPSTSPPTTIGIAESNLYSMSNAEIDKALDKMLSLGVTNVRVGVFWLNIQPTSATKYNWAKTDYIVKAASDRGMAFSACSTRPPPWLVPWVTAIRPGHLRPVRRDRRRAVRGQDLGLRDLERAQRIPGMEPPSARPPTPRCSRRPTRRSRRSPRVPIRTSR